MSEFNNQFPPLINLGNTINKNFNLDKTALIDLSTGQKRKFTFEDIDNLSNRAAGYLKSLGLVKGNKVGIVAKNSAEYLILLYGIFRLGLVAVPLNYKTPLTELDHIIEESQCSVTFSDCGIGKDLYNSMTNLPDCPLVEIEIPNKQDEGLILYTSGSKDLPKAVSITHTNHLYVIKRSRYKSRQYGHLRIGLISAPLYHMNGLSTLQGSIASHSTTFLLPEFNAKTYLQLLNQYPINTLYTVTPMMAMLLEEKPLVDQVDLSKVKLVNLASSPLSEKLYNNIKKYFVNATLLNSYGCTEVGPGLFGQHPNPEIKRPPLSVGYPTGEIEMRIVDGILQLKSPGMFKNYSNRPDLNQSQITKDGFFITNDLFEIDENGFYFFKGRADDMFKSGGNSVYPSKIERILERHPKISLANVVVLDDEIKSKKPYAFVKVNDTISEQEIKEFFLKESESYMLPRKIWIIDSFPVTNTNKIDIKELERQAKQRLLSRL